METKQGRCESGPLLKGNQMLLVLIVSLILAATGNPTAAEFDHWLFVFFA